MCVSKARWGKYIITLSKEEMATIDTELLSTLDLFDYYKQLEKKLKDKNLYINKLKAQLEELKTITKVDSFEKLKKKIFEKI